MQAPMSGAPLIIKELGVHTFPVIPEPQPKLPFLVLDFHLDLPRLCVPEGVAHRLARNPVDFIAEYRMEVTRRAFHLDTKESGVMIGFIGRELFSESAYGQRKIVGHHRG